MDADCHRDSQKQAEKSLIETGLASARDMAFVASIFLIFLGTVYRHQYFTSFGMRTSMADASLYLILLNAYDVLVDHAIGVAATGVVAVAALAAISIALRRSPLPAAVNRGIVAAIASVLVVAAFPALAAIGRDSALTQSTKVRGRYLIGARVHIKPERLSAFPQASLLDDASVSVVGQSDRDLFVIYQPPKQKLSPRVAPDADLYWIPRDAIDYVESSLVAVSEK